LPEPRRICVVTGTRAEYGLLYWLMKEIAADPALALRLIVTGAHLAQRFGHTVDVIERDGFRIDARVPLDLGDDTPAAITRATGAAVAGIGDALASLAPDIVVVLGDRYEILAAATAAALHRVPVAHLHGGEVTQGAVDDAMRHAITKMSHLHFAAAEPYRRRILQMGEDPAHVHTVGTIGLDNIERLELMDADALGRDIGLDLSGGYFLVTYHPATLSDTASETGAAALVEALDRFPELKVILTGVNADAGNAAIRRVFDAFAAANPERVASIVSMGQVRYLSAMKHCAAVVGNSSSGLVEAPSLGVPTVNIGDRQKGRLRATSVIDCGDGAADIAAAIEAAIGDTHRKVAKRTVSPFGTSGVSARIAAVLRDTPLQGILAKRFVDLDGGDPAAEVHLAEIG
jgi:UDP-hydrolysing UDP-N-acetyl-D-glucosamine 2-epimerase